MSNDESSIRRELYDVIRDKSKNYHVREQSILSLSNMNGTHATSLLINILQDKREDINIRQKIAFVLFQNNPHDAKRVFSGIAKDPTDGFILPLIVALDLTQPENPYLAKLIMTSLVEAMKGLYVKMKDRDGDVYYDWNETTWVKVADALKIFGDSVKQPILHWANKGEITAIRMLGEIGDVKNLKPILDYYARNQYESIAATSIKKIISREKNRKLIIEELAKLTQDSNSFIRQYVLNLLNEVDKDNSVGLLIVAVRDKDASVRRKAVIKLGETRAKQAVPPLIMALRQDADSSVRQAAAESLGKIGDSKAFIPLNDAFENADQALAEKIVQSLGLLKDLRAVETIIKFLEKYNSYSLVAEKALLELGEPVIELLLQSINHPQSRVRIVLISVLGQLGAKKAILPLKTLSKDKDSFVREEIAKAFGLLKDASTLEALLELSNDTDPTVRQNAVEALGLIGDEKAVNELIIKLYDYDASVRKMAAKALGIIKDETSVEALYAALHDENSSVRWEIKVALANMGYKA